MIRLIRKHMLALTAIICLIIYCIIMVIKLTKPAQVLQIEQGGFELNQIEEYILQGDSVAVVQEKIDEEVNEEIDIDIPVYICGEVNFPGVYYVPESSIVQDVLGYANGASEDADLNQVNLAKKVQPHQQIYIPKIGEQLIIDEQEYLQTSSKININQASATTLQALPGIGEVKANQIIEYRKTKGGFDQKEELMEVSGIGPKTYEALADQITLE